MCYAVAMCTYNGATYIKEQLQSIMDQTIRPVQVVVCDDKSQDETVSIVNDFAKDHLSVEWKIIENKENIGFVRNFEQAIELCDNKIVFLSDQDDVWLREKAEKILKFFETNPHSVVFTDALLVNENLESIDATMFENINFNQTDQKLFYKGNNGRGLMLHRFIATGATMAFKKSAVQKFLPVPDNKYFIHDSWIATLAKCNHDLGFINEPLILYRQHPGQSLGGELESNLELRRKNFWEESVKVKDNRKKAERLKATLKFYYEREVVIFNFVQQNKSIFPNETLKFLKGRNQVFRKFQRDNKNFFTRFFNLSIYLYIYRIIEFQSFRKLIGNTFNFIFYR